MVKKYFWKVWLRLNPLTKDPKNDYVAEASTLNHTQHNEDIARRIVQERSEFRFETILSILYERDAVVRDMALSGSPVQDSNIRIAPRVPGNWMGANPVYDPQVHKLTLDATLTADMRKGLKEVGVEILGKKADGGAIIGLVTDVLSGHTDGLVSLGGDLIITGEKIKVAPEGGQGLGVFFVDETGRAIPLDYPLVRNVPKRIICRLPAQLTAGKVYTLKIITRYTKGQTLLTEPRTIEYALPLSVTP
jgi:hypothetical protein